ncbi:hypothetical protein ACIBCN_01195 [Nocardia sp. NPDC051052]|uniref:hypothetical protein n=1 Tax=Nocardia sp. NPDC051052 TaxID=3364322 RepID=UPI0037AE25BB
MTLVSRDELIQPAPSRPPPEQTGPRLYDIAEFTELGDRLVRKLFDSGLRLDTIRMAFDRDGLTTVELNEHRTAIVEVLANLDSMIRTTGLAMLSLTAAAPMAELRSRRLR